MRQIPRPRPFAVLAALLLLLLLLWRRGISMRMTLGKDVVGAPSSGATVVPLGSDSATAATPTAGWLLLMVNGGWWRRRRHGRRRTCWEEKRASC